MFITNLVKKLNGLNVIFKTVRPYKTNIKYNIIQHNLTHNIVPTWYSCEKGCDDIKFKREADLNRHYRTIHNIGTIWFYCEEENCVFKTKNKGNLTVHLSAIHNINVILHYCPFNDCNYICKSNSILNKHL
jgi:hypothetical protein